MNSVIERPAASRRSLLALLLATGAATLLTAGLALVPTAAPAAEVPVQQVVRISDLNLASAEGQRTLDRRVRVAIDRMCTTSGSRSPRNAHLRQVQNECRDEARAQIVRQLTERGLPTQVLATRG